MNELKHALNIIVELLEDWKVPYMVFGGIAMGVYANSRQTFDIDIKVCFESEKGIKKFIHDLEGHSEFVSKNPVKFIRETNVLPVDVEGVRVDFVFAQLPFEKEAIQRSVKKKIFDVEVKVCRPEDLIIQKVISTRMKDWTDIERIVDHQRKALNWDYLIKHCGDLSKFLDDPSILAKINNLKHVK